MTDITYLSPGTTDLRQIVFAVDQALERLQGLSVNLTTSPSANSVVGTTTNDNATAGNIGEYVSSTITSTGATSLSNNTIAAITSISLTPGDWDVDGAIQFTGGSSAVVNAFIGGASSSTAAFSGNNINPLFGLKPFNFANPCVVLAPISRQSLATTSSVWLLAEAFFSADTCSAYGSIRARRVR